jgi:hypothetical protein
MNSNLLVLSGDACTFKVPLRFSQASILVLHRNPGIGLAPSISASEFRFHNSVRV